MEIGDIVIFQMQRSARLLNHNYLYYSGEPVEFEYYNREYEVLDIDYRTRHLTCRCLEDGRRYCFPESYLPKVVRTINIPVIFDTTPY